MTWDNLSVRQKEALLLIGISDPEQFQRIEISRLHGDLNAAFASFPAVKETLSEQELSELMSLEEVPADSSEKNADEDETLSFNFKRKGKVLPLPEIDLTNYKIDDQFYILNKTSKGTVLAAFTVFLAFCCLITFFVLVYTYVTAPMPPDKIDVWSALVCLLGILPYFFFAFRSKVRHHFPLLGYQLPTALHILLFRKFRCPSCGTPQRLKRK